MPPDAADPAAPYPARPGAISLIAFASRTRATLAWREVLEDPGPEPTIGVLAEILMATCAGQIHRANRILMSSHWTRLDDEMVGAYPASQTPLTAVAVAGVGERDRRAQDAGRGPARMLLTDRPTVTGYLYVLDPAPRAIDLYSAENGTWAARHRTRIAADY
ncbi:hypothetical protein KDK95_29365 [Actinospica sp. MGRD01-02]|uniref:Uncharacterized protein n=1 Tax=Actinospica acidithermotolerans TaxID=2828514 RepID=A0A941EFD7_9ACTN|nr:hypothetical protein [Actinospica acidithermotolerans]MBR7830446.1 hypothetical protein [Actinospica acidithermotolerans]